MYTLPSVAAKAESTQFSLDVHRGLSPRGQKTLPSSYLYDAIGSALFDVITLLPEYGLTRADERVLTTCADELSSLIDRPLSVAELGSGSGRKTRRVLAALADRCIAYYPIDVSIAALDACEKELGLIANIRPLQGNYLEGLSQAAAKSEAPMLVLFLGSTIGNFGSTEAVEFLRNVRGWLKPGDRLLLGADLIKPIDRMIAAYDDSIGVTAAFNLNLLARINRELSGSFNLTEFSHEVVWNAGGKRIEMHLRSLRAQTIEIAGTSYYFSRDETIWTESSHKFTLADLDELAACSGWNPVRTWTDLEWPFANCLWQA